MSVKDFYDAGLRTLLRYHGESPDEALVFAGVLPFLGANGHWTTAALRSRSNRIRAVRGVVRLRITRTGSVRGIGVADFRLA